MSLCCILLLLIAVASGKSAGVDHQHSADACSIETHDSCSRREAEVEDPIGSQNPARNVVWRPLYKERRGATASYYYPQGRGQPEHFGQSPYSFGGRACNLSAMRAWTWTHPAGRFAAVTTGKAVVDDRKCVYLTQESVIYKLSPEGSLIWKWQPQNQQWPGRHLPRHSALYDGLLYNCISDGSVFAIDMETGFQVWETRVANQTGGDTGFVTVYAGRVFLDVDPPDPTINRKNRIVSLNASTGEMLWEYRPDSGVWNFLPHYLGDDTLLFMGWHGDAHRLNITTGRELWRSGHLNNYTGWTDGGPALGPNGVFYTVSSKSPQSAATHSSGGGIHAFAVEDGRLIWEHTDLEQGVYTYPGVGRLDPNSNRIAVVTGVGSLAGIPLLATLVGLLHFGPIAVVLGFVFWLLRLLICMCCAKCRTRQGPQPHLRGLLVWLVFCVAFTYFSILVWAHVYLFQFGYSCSIHAFDGESGSPIWRANLPKYNGYTARSDEQRVLPAWFAGNRLFCLPAASGYGVVDAAGVFWMPHLDGHLWRVKDWNGNGRIDDDGEELCSVDVGSAAATGGVTIVPGMLLVTTCDGLTVFKE